MVGWLAASASHRSVHVDRNVEGVQPTGADSSRAPARKPNPERRRLPDETALNLDESRSGDLHQQSSAICFTILDGMYMFVKCV